MAPPTAKASPPLPARGQATTGLETSSVTNRKTLCHRRRRVAAPHVPCDKKIVNRNNGVASPCTSVSVHPFSVPVPPATACSGAIRSLCRRSSLSSAAGDRSRACLLPRLLAHLRPVTRPPSVGAGHPRLTLPLQWLVCACAFGWHQGALRVSAAATWSAASWHLAYLSDASSPAAAPCALPF